MSAVGRHEQGEPKHDPDAAHRREPRRATLGGRRALVPPVVLPLVMLVDPLVAAIDVGKRDRFLDQPGNLHLGSGLGDQWCCHAAQAIVRAPRVGVAGRRPGWDVGRQLGDAVVTGDCGTQRGAVEQVDQHRRCSCGAHTFGLGLRTHRGRDGVTRLQEPGHDTPPEHAGSARDEHSLTHHRTP